ncbi:MAG: single-stranded-DNA-specific exonuclease RecJ [Patescibacteria group bacterium]
MQNKEKLWKVAPKKGKDIFEQLAINRNISNLEEFITPPSPQETLNRIFKEDKILKSETDKAKKLISEAIKKKSPIYIHGDYDVDGICATAILWEKIYFGLKYKNCFPYIPDRFNEGYGLSKESVDSIIKTLPKENKSPLIITVDCGISSIKEVLYAKEKGFNVIICDHHQKGKNLPKANAILWTDKLCAAGIAWVLSESGFDLSALATVADVQPLTGYNRSLVKYGLLELNKLKRTGLKALVEISGIKDKKIGVYEVGWVIGPRLNASGRLESALDSLRLLCTTSNTKALAIAKSLNLLNSKRQEMTFSIFEESKKFYKKDLKIIISEGKRFHEGIIGLVAGKLVSEYYLPSIVISKKEKISKGSARSVSGVDIIKMLRNFEDLFESVGGHPMAAGFSIKNEQLENLVRELYIFSEKNIKDEDIIQEIKIDAEMSLEEVTYPLLDFVGNFAPFGLGNPEPVFLTRNVEIYEIRKIGKDGGHLKISFKDSTGDIKNGVAFGFGGFEAVPKDKVDIVYTLNENIWNGRRNLDLRIRDIRKSGFN